MTGHPDGRWLPFGVSQHLCRCFHTLQERIGTVPPPPIHARGVRKTHPPRLQLIAVSPRRVSRLRQFHARTCRRERMAKEFLLRAELPLVRIC
jgi:hypothetical protein